MPIIKEVKKPCKCEGKPLADNYGVGTQWQCDKCSAIYEVKYGSQREPGNWWDRLTRLPGLSAR